MSIAARHAGGLPVRARRRHTPDGEAEDVDEPPPLLVKLREREESAPPPKTGREQRAKGGGRRSRVRR